MAKKPVSTTESTIEKKENLILDLKALGVVKIEGRTRSKMVNLGLKKLETVLAHALVPDNKSRCKVQYDIDLDKIVPLEDVEVVVEVRTTPIDSTEEELEAAEAEKEEVSLEVPESEEISTEEMLVAIEAVLEEEKAEVSDENVDIIETGEVAEAESEEVDVTTEESTEEITSDSEGSSDSESDDVEEVSYNLVSPNGSHVDGFFFEVDPHVFLELKENGKVSELSELNPALSYTMKQYNHAYVRCASTGIFKKLYK